MTELQLNPDETLIALSLGAGAQSSALGMMAAHGLVTPMPHVAIFADTGAEPKYVYDYLGMLEDLFPFPVIRVQKGEGLRVGIMESATPNEDGDFTGRFAGAPFYTTSDSSIGMGMLRRQCTREFKIEPITKKVRELVGLQPRQRAPKNEDGTTKILAEQWIGISWDEKQRMKEPREKWLRHRWPLIELGWSRLQCIEFMNDINLPRPQKSACTFCPYRTNAEWRDMKNNHPEAFADAVEVDEAIRNGVRGTTEQLYVHRSMQPLATADLSDVDGMQTSFLDECDGMCGV